jgi:hypothetical protein
MSCMSLIGSSTGACSKSDRRNACLESTIMALTAQPVLQLLSSFLRSKA